MTETTNQDQIKVLTKMKLYIAENSTIVSQEMFYYKFCGNFTEESNAGIILTATALHHYIASSYLYNGLQSWCQLLQLQ